MSTIVASIRLNNLSVSRAHVSVTVLLIVEAQRSCGNIRSLIALPFPASPPQIPRILDQIHDYILQAKISAKKIPREFSF